MDELPIHRASNPFKNQGYLLRLADMPRSQRRRRRRKRQRGGRLSGWVRKQQGGGMGTFSAAKVPIAATLDAGFHIGKSLGKTLLKLMGVSLKKKYKYR